MGAALSETASTEGTSSEAEQLPADADGQGTDSGTDGIDYKALYEAEKAEHAKWKSTSRKHEERAKANAQAASKTKTVEEQLAELQQKIADGESIALAKSGKLAIAQVQAKLAAAGYKPEDVSGLLNLISPESLLKDGEPDGEAVENLAKTLIKVGGRSTPDPDQGRKSGSAVDMNALLRRAVGR